MFAGSSSIKYKKRAKIFSNSTGTITYDPLTKTSYSYSHWPITMMIDGKLVFNTYKYSNTTNSHVWCIHAHLRSTNTKIDLVVNTLTKLSDFNFLNVYLNKLVARKARYRAEHDSKYTRKVQLPRLTRLIQDTTDDIVEFIKVFGDHPDLINYTTSEEDMYIEALQEYEKDKKHTIDLANTKRKEKYYRVGLTDQGMRVFGILSQHWSYPAWVNKTLYNKVIKGHDKYPYYFGRHIISDAPPTDREWLEITADKLPGYLRHKANREIDDELG